MRTLREKNKKIKKVIFLALLFVFAAVFSFFETRAALLITVTDTLSRVKVSQSSTHALKFQTLSGVDSSTDTIIVTFAAGFTVPAVAPGDVTLTHGPTSGTETSETLAATAAADTWGVASSGQAVTLTPPTNAAAGEILLNHFVIITISGITNPSVAGNYTNYVTGNFGDEGSARVSIVSDDQVSVSATVSGATGGGVSPPPPAPPPPADVTPPTISNIQVTEISSSTAKITWTTDESSSTNVDYGKTESYEIGTAAGASGVTAHTVTLTNLDGGTLYHFRVRSADAAGNQASSADQTFTTIIFDITPPVISGVSATNITNESVDIVWQTNEAATSIVDYGETINYEIGSLSNPILVTEHLIVITGLTPATTYHFRVRSADGAGNTAVSPDATFTTIDGIPPLVLGLGVRDITPSGATVFWDTDELATSEVRYGRTNFYELGSKIDGTLKLSHSLSLTNLLGNTTYYFRAVSSDASGNTQISAETTFVTLPDSTPPANVGDLFAEPEETVIQLTWTNPPDPDFAGVRVQRSTTSFPLNPGDGVTAFQGTDNFFRDTGLSSQTTYYYAVFAFDTSFNFSSGALTLATTLAPPPAPPAPPEEAPPAPPTPEEAPPLGIRPGEEEPKPIVTAPPVTIPPVSVGAEMKLTVDDLYFWAAQSSLQLKPTRDAVRTLPKSVFGITISGNKFSQTPQKIILTINGVAYLLTINENRQEHSTSFVTPKDVGPYKSTLIITYEDGANDVIEFSLLIDPYGYVYEKIGGQETRVLGARVTLLIRDPISRVYQTWDAVPFKQTNPALTPVDGTFGFFVPPGTYQLRAEKDGYRKAETSPFEVRDVIINRNLELLRPPPPLSEVIKPDASLAENIAAVAKNLGEKSVFAAKAAQEEVVKVIDNPEVEEANRAVAAPAIITVAAANVATVASFWNFLTYIQYLALQPLLLLQRRKRKGWGTVYNALTKLPVDLAIVRLIDAKTNRLAATRVTDKEGRYAFIVNTGSYRLEITKPGYVFPTKYLAAQKSDLDFTELYHGETIEVTEQGATLNVNVPLDPLEKVLPPKKIYWQRYGRLASRAISVSSIFFAGASFAITPEPLYGVLLGLQVALFLLFRRLARVKKPKTLGIIYDAKTGKPLRYAIARIFDTQFNKLLETQVTDARGRYYFLVGRNVYYATYEKQGYIKEIKDALDFTREKKEAAVNLKVGLKKAEEAAKFERESR